MSRLSSASRPGTRKFGLLRGINSASKDMASAFEARLIGGRTYHHRGCPCPVWSQVMLLTYTPIWRYEHICKNGAYTAEMDIQFTVLIRISL